MDIIVSKKKIITYSIIAITILLVLVTVATYAYFQADVTATNTVTVNSNTASGSYSFTSYADNSISMELTAQDMMENSSLISATVAKETGSANLFVNLDAPEGSTVKCTYNIVWKWNSGSSYYETDTSSVLSTDYPNQYSVLINKDSGNTGTTVNALAEKDLSKFTWSSHKTTLYVGEIIAIDGASVTDRYEVTSKMYNINVDQPDIKEKNFDASITIEDVNCKFPTEFEADSWTTIKTNIQNNNTSQYNVGDTKCISLNSSVDSSINMTTNGSCGCTNGQYCIRLVNKSACSSETLSDSTKSQTACGYVLMFEDIITKHNINKTMTNTGGWPVTLIRAYLNGTVDSTTKIITYSDTVGQNGEGTIYNALPSDLKSSIIDTYVISSYEPTATQTTNFNSTDKLYLLSPEELEGSSHSYSEYNTAVDSSRQLDYFLDPNQDGNSSDAITSSNYSALIRKYNGTRLMYSLRATYASGNKYHFFIVDHTGLLGGYAAQNSARGVLPAFRIG